MTKRFLRTVGGLLLAAGIAPGQAPKLEFEVASVKPAQPIEAQASSGKLHIGMQIDGARVDIGSMRLADLIPVAFKVKWYQVSGPAWLSFDIMSAPRFDVMGKMPEGAAAEQVPAMLQALLADRFQMTFHRESREHAIYALVVAKGGPKLKPAKQSDAGGDDQQDPDAPKPVRFDSAGYPTFAPGESGTRSTPHGRAHMHEPRMTMGWLAATLSGSLHATVTDATGLNGEHEIDLYWVLDSAPTAASADDESGPTLVQALQKELGLRLEKSANGTKDVLVVDHAERVPTGN